MRGLLAIGVMLLAGNAYADGEFPSLITAPDKQRLQVYETIRAEAIAEAKQSDLPERREVLRLLGKKPRSFDGLDLTGSWQCRTAKLGGNLPLVRYGWFKCRVTDDGSGWQLTKLTGSQRTQGRFYTGSDTQLYYLGSFYVAGETPRAYGTGPDTDQFAIATRTGKQTWRLEFPSPRYESKLDVIEFKR